MTIQTSGKVVSKLLVLEQLITQLKDVNIHLSDEEILSTILALLDSAISKE